MAQNPPPSQSDPESKEVRDRRDFFIGMIGSLALNWIIFNLINNVNIPFTSSLTWLPWVLNVIAIITLLLLRLPSVVLGMLASYGLAIVVVLCISLATCFGEI